MYPFYDSKSICKYNVIGIFLEPIGSAKPMFPTSSETMGTFKVANDQMFSMICPAQGSPIPAFR